jgi:hypothetical protein
MKQLSWGYKITIFYLSFVVGILFLVYKANGEKYDLVTDNYYEESLTYQDVVDQKSNVARLSAPLVISHNADVVTIQLPEEFKGRKSTGELYFYRASDAARDVRLPLSVEGTDIRVALPKPVSGAYELKLSWQSNGQHYFHEQKIYF